MKSSIFNHQQYQRLFKLFSAVAMLFAVQIVYATNLNLANTPLFISNTATPVVMLNISKDHQLFFKAYDDYSDLNGDGYPDTTYNNTIVYNGYFDSYKCYNYDATSQRFEPYALTPNFYCNGYWSGNFLNWATMSRIDSIRKILYGGLRSTDNGADTTSTSTATSVPQTSAPATSAPVTSAPVITSTTTTAPVKGTATTTAFVAGAPTTSAPVAGTVSTTAPVAGSATTTAAVAGASSTSNPVSTAAVAGSPSVSAVTTTNYHGSLPANTSVTSSVVPGAASSTAPVKGSSTNSATVTSASVSTAPVQGASTSTAPVQGATTTSTPVQGPSTNGAITYGAPTNSAPTTTTTNSATTNGPTTTTTSPTGTESSYTSAYTTTANSNYNSTYTGKYTTSYNTTYNSTYNTTYTTSYSTTYTSSYNTTYNTSYNTTYHTSYTSNYTVTNTVYSLNSSTHVLTATTTVTPYSYVTTTTTTTPYTTTTTTPYTTTTTTPYTTTTTTPYKATTTTPYTTTTTNNYKTTTTTTTTTSTSSTTTTTTVTGLTVLERSYLPNDAHSFAKYYNGPDISQLTPFSSNQVSVNGGGITLCNTTVSSTTFSQNVTDPPLIRVAAGNFALWNANERWQCRWIGEQNTYNGNNAAVSGLSAAGTPPNKTNNGLGLADYVARVEVCVGGLIGTENCKTYTNSSTGKTTLKPIGLLQTYGDNNQLNFGLLTGSYGKNKSGGVLRKNVSSMNNEINVSTDGTFIANPTGGGIIQTLNAFRMYGYVHANEPNNGVYFISGGAASANATDGSANCIWGINTFPDGSCSNWGNPQSEMYLESLRYFANQSASSAFLPASPTLDSFYFPSLSVATTKVTASNPTVLPSAQWCAKQSLIDFNASTSSYDGDQLGTFTDIAASTFIDSVPVVGSPSVNALTDALGVGENIPGNNFFVGSNGGAGTSNSGSCTTTNTINDQLCTAKTVNKLSCVSGTCPDAPRLSGTYELDGLAWFGHTYDLVPNNILQGNQSVTTFGVALAPKLPLITVPVPGSVSKTVTIIPACQDTTVGGNCTQADFKIIPSQVDPTKPIGCAELGFPSQTGSVANNCGKLYVNWDDSEQGGDFDMDMWGVLSYLVTPTQVQIKTQTVYQSTPYAMGLGYVISGTTADGFHAHSGINGYSYVDPNPGIATGTNAVTATGVGAVTETDSVEGAGLATTNTEVISGIGTSTISIQETETATGVGSLSNNDIKTTSVALVGTGTVTGSTSEGTSGSGAGTVSTASPIVQINASGAAIGSATVSETVYQTVGGVQTSTVTFRGTAASNGTSTRCRGCSYYSDSASSVTYTIGNTSAASLQQPLWYASKWGGFLDDNKDGKPDSPSEWDANKNGIPDNYFYATNPASLTSGLSQAFNDVLGGGGSSASNAANSTKLQKGTVLYQAQFNSISWIGHLYNFTVQANGTVLNVDGHTPLDAGDANWDAATLIPAPNNRNIYTYNPSGGNGGGVGTPFLWSTGTPTLSNSQIAALNTSSAGVVDNLGQLRLNWLRGDTSQEVRFYQQNQGNFRNRPTTVLGDIVNSTPIYSQSEDYGYSGFASTVPEQSSYASYVASKATRIPMVYDGANDGMLHGFRADTGASNSGVELLAYVPNAVFPRLSSLTDPNYIHQYYVDGSPNISDAYLNGSWRTVLVGGLNAGGKAVYALDITDPSAFTATNVLWEYSGSTTTDTGSTGVLDSDGLGLTFSQPQVAKMNDGSWAVIFGNGYNSNSGQAFLYIVNLSTGQLMAKIATNASTSNGLSTPVLYDQNGDKIIDVAYAGDLQGNLWKFDLTANTSASWVLANSAQPLFTAYNSSNQVQPITAKPTVGAYPFGGALVYFGTGSYLTNADVSNIDTQSFYAIYDKATSVSAGTLTRSNLVQQTITETVSQGTTNPNADCTAGSSNCISTYGYNLRGISTNTVNYASKSGWYMDLTTGERVVSTPLIVNGLIVFVTEIPSLDPCQIGGTSWIMELDELSGGAPATTPFDLNGDGQFNGQDSLPNGGVAGGIQSTVGMIQGLLELDSSVTANGVTTTTYYLEGNGNNGNEMTTTAGVQKFGTPNSGVANRLYWLQIQ